MRSYNGHSPEKRLAALAWLKTQWAAGKLPIPDKCIACLRTYGTIQGHNEDYDHPERYVPICNVCHMMIHCRFRNLVRWKQYRDYVRKGWQPPPKSHTEVFGFIKTTYLAGKWGTMRHINPERESTYLDTLPDVELGTVNPTPTLF